MKSIRRVISGTFYLIGTWVILSFIGVMFNPSNAEIWTQSLMWSLLASLIILPGLVFAHHAGQTRQRKKEASVSEETKETPFIEEEHRDTTLWPTSEEQSSQR